MKILIIISLCFVLISLVLFPLYALELVKQDEKNIFRAIEGDFDGDGSVDTVTLKSNKSKTNEHMVNYDLEVKSKGKYILIENVLMDESESFCGLEKIVVSSKITPFIGILYHTGAYSWILKLYGFDGKTIRKVDEFGSDGHSIQVKDVDNDGENEIVITNRDWDHNSVEDHIIDTYKYNGKKWTLISAYETKTKKFISIVKKMNKPN